MGKGISPVHPGAGGIEFAPLINDRADVGSFAALIPGTPEKDGRMVPVAQHHFSNPLAVHGFPGYIGRDEFSSVRLIPGLVDDVQPIFVGQFEVFRHGWIVGGTHTIDTELLQDLKILANGGFVHGMSQIGMLHVAVDGVQLDGLPVEVENLVADFGLLESDASGDHLFGFALPVDQLHGEMVKVRSLCRPLLWIFYQ